MLKSIIKLSATFILAASATSTTFANNTRSHATEQHPVVAYILLSNPGSDDQTNSITQLYTKYVTNHTKPNFTQINFSFLSPTMNGNDIQQDIINNNLGKLLNDSILGIDNQSPEYKQASTWSKDATNLQDIINQMHKNNVKVYFSVGGWAYSNTGSGTGWTTFPLTTDILTDIQNYKPKATKEELQNPTHQALDNQVTSDLANTWESVVNAFQGDGIDLDYEEMWFTAQANKNIGDPTNNDRGSSYDNYATIKYAAYIKALEQESESNSNHLSVSIAAPAVGAFDVNTVAKDQYAGNLFFPADSSAPLKGVIYNMAHYDEANLDSVAGLFTFNNKNILNNLSSIGIMSYDLDDGDTGYPAAKTNINSWWCIGWIEQAGQQGYGVARGNPKQEPLAHINDVSCSVYDQTIAITKMFDALKLDTQINAGIEAYYPNYPIDPKLSLGDPSTPNQRYRWNDPYLPFDMPIQSNIDTATLDQDAQQVIFNKIACQPYATQESSYKHKWLQPGKLTTDIINIPNAPQHGVIFWSLLNAEQTTLAADQAQLNTQQPSNFGVFYTTNKNLPLIRDFMPHVLSWDEALQEIYDAANGATPATVNGTITISAQDSTSGASVGTDTDDATSSANSFILQQGSKEVNLIFDHDTITSGSTTYIPSTISFDSTSYTVSKDSSSGDYIAKNVTVDGVAKHDLVINFVKQEEQ